MVQWQSLKFNGLLVTHFSNSGSFDQFKVAANLYSFSSCCKTVLLQQYSHKPSTLEFVSINPESPTLKFSPAVFEGDGTALKLIKVWSICFGIVLWTEVKMTLNQRKKKSLKVWFIPTFSVNYSNVCVWLKRMNSHNDQRDFQSDSSKFWEAHALR